MTTRCNILVKDPISRRVRKCQKKVSIHSRCICMTHARIYIIKIQKWIRGYLLRKKLKTFSLLPCDVWRHILYYMTYQHKIKHCFQKSIDNVYQYKINNLKNKMKMISINGTVYEAHSEEIRTYGKYMNEAKRLNDNRNYVLDMINKQGIIIV